MFVIPFIYVLLIPLLNLYVTPWVFPLIRLYLLTNRLSILTGPPSVKYN
jgi:hypothetical protein